VDLGGWRFEDARNSMELPSVVLHPGEFALLVGENYDPTSWVDTPPAPEALLIRVEAFGKKGLSNQGVPVRLTRPDGTEVSMVPSIASKKPGESISRVRPEALDDLGSFFMDREGGTPGWANREPDR
ncbi:MAG: lamin tail domain-containing protein, partial [Polyangiaceae bacterium]|nr:lamin tail domain-containing protein [Polyangiaceae bacterium]